MPNYDARGINDYVNMAQDLQSRAKRGRTTDEKTQSLMSAVNSYENRKQQEGVREKAEASSERVFKSIEQHLG